MGRLGVESIIRGKMAGGGAKRKIGKAREAL